MIRNFKNVMIAGVAFAACCGSFQLSLKSEPCALKDAFAVVQKHTDEQALLAAVQHYAQHAQQVLDAQVAVNNADQQCVLAAKNFVQKVESFFAEHGAALVGNNSSMSAERKKNAQLALNEFYKLEKQHAELVKQVKKSATSGIQKAIVDVQNAFCADVEGYQAALEVPQQNPQEQAHVQEQAQEADQNPAPQEQVQAEAATPEQAPHLASVFLSNPRAVVAASVGAVVIGGAATLWFLKTKITELFGQKENA